MVRASFRMLVAAGILAGLAGAAEASSTDMQGEKLASASPETSLQSVEPAAAPVRSVAARSDCTRKVKVVYAGYGEAARASCTMASAEPAR